MVLTFTAQGGTTVDLPEEFLTGSSLTDMGYCRACAAEREGTEPDAENYACDVCEQQQVFGAQQLLLMGEIV